MSIGSQKKENIEKIQMCLQFIIQCVTLIFFRVFFVLEITGEKEAYTAMSDARKKEEGILFAANHISEWDAIMVRICLPFKVFFNPMYYVAMTKEHYQHEKFGWRKYFYGGTIFKALGAYPAYIGMRDYQASLVNHTELLEYGKAICIFPEGKISVNVSKPSEAKGGIGFLAEYTKTNIIPVTLTGFGSISWMKVFTLQRPKLSVVYHNIVKIHEVLEIAKEQNITEGIDTNKFVSEYIMTKIRV
jgi:1-acyl-sn-glycerol-3-phosphate acyltransferase